MAQCLPPVLAVVYLRYNCRLWVEAIRLTRILVVLMPDKPEVVGAAGAAVVDRVSPRSPDPADGSLIVLSELDRGRWDRALIEAQKIVGRPGRPWPYNLDTLAFRGI
jgi:RNA polymerase sigma-70 factor, ECF subfamily